MLHYAPEDRHEADGDHLFCLRFCADVFCATNAARQHQHQISPTAAPASQILHKYTHLLGRPGTGTKATPCKSLICRGFRTTAKYKVSLLYLFRTRVATPYFCIHLYASQLQTSRVASLRKILVSETGMELLQYKVYIDITEPSGQLTSARMIRNIKKEKM